MIHRVILGSVEHMFVILLEHYKGKWPFWLSPLQAIVREAQLAQYKYMLVVVRPRKTWRPRGSRRARHLSSTHGRQTVPDTLC
ncbi:hypothetical protein VIGAN_08346300 [Vigna angularis var. angularis]|uniref:Uncharacterized protein n=1 Tax=Vigna angularis var. angularis TaxID=157739 RepID=A0A0S3SUI1_PHAAN|nr:hypothetical protein VIGAN_08346300 [Vigna angularis var. angularis]